MVLFLGNLQAQKVISSHTIGFQAKPYSKILVVVKAKKEYNRVQMEDDIVNQLMDEDIEAVPSYLRLSGGVLENIESQPEALELLVSTLREKGFEGILVSSMVAANQSVEYNPGQYQATAVPVRYGRFGRYYGTAVVTTYEPASVETHQNYVLESLLYDLRGDSKEDSLHWIGKIKITDPANFDKASSKYAKILVKELKKKAFE